MGQSAPTGWDMAAPGWSYKCEQEGPKEVERLLTAWQGAHCFLQKTTMSLPAGFVSQQRALLQSCVGERRNKCPQGCCEEHTSEQLLSLLSNLNFNRIFFPVLPGVLGSLCTCCCWDRQPQVARTHCWPRSPRWGRSPGRRRAGITLTLHTLP